MNIQVWFPLGWTGWISLQSKGCSRVFSDTTVQRHQFFGSQPSLWYSSHICTRLKWKGESCILHSHKISWERPRILLSARTQAGAKFLASRLRGALGLRREGSQTDRSRSLSLVSYAGQSPEHSAHTCPRRMLLRRKALPTKTGGRWLMTVKEKGICLAHQSSSTWPKTGRAGREKAVSHTWPERKGRALHRILTVLSKLDLGGLVKLSWKLRTNGVCLNRWKRRRREAVKIWQRIGEGSGGKIDKTPCLVHFKVLTVPDMGFINT